MGRIRTVKPEVAKHELLYELERSTGLPVRFAWVMLPSVCDREGRFKWRPRALKADILPYDDCDFADVLGVLVRAEMLVRYQVSGETYGCIPTFQKHQSVNQREAASLLPEPPSTCIPMLELGDAPVEGKGREGKGDHQGTEGMVVMEFQVAGKSGPYRLTERQIAEWQALYPGLDILQESKKAKAWVTANPGRKKTLGGMPRFLANWFNRATDRVSQPTVPALTRRNQTTLGAAARIMAGSE